MDFTAMDLNTITSGVSGDGVKYLELFLKAYTALTSEKVNPGCNKCLTSYLTKYKNLMSQDKNKSGYILKAKYENIPLEFGSDVLVNNGNINEDYARKLLSHVGGEMYFDTIPDGHKQDKKDDAPVITLETLQADVDDAQKAHDELPSNAHHNTRRAAVTKLEKAKDAFAAFQKQSEDELKQAKTVILEITQNDLDRLPALATEGYVVGSKVKVDTSIYTEEAGITIESIIEDVESEQ